MTGSWGCGSGAAAALLLLCGAVCSAEPITIEFTGRADVILGGVTHRDVRYTIVLESDTDQRVVEPPIYTTPGAASFEIDGVGSGALLGDSAVFVNAGVGAAGLRTTTGVGVMQDALNLRSDEFLMWDMLSSIGPIFDPAPFATGQFVGAPTTVGPLTLSALDVTFVATVGDGCYADCDGSGSLDFFDFLCFQNAFAAAEPYADCDGSGGLDFFDFLCFQNEFAAGCP